MVSTKTRPETTRVRRSKTEVVFCETCDNPIDPRRVDFLQKSQISVVNCVTCQQQEEMAGATTRRHIRRSFE